MYHFLNIKIINALKEEYLLHFIFITTFFYLVIEYQFLIRELKYIVNKIFYFEIIKQSNILLSVEAAAALLIK